jgi:tetratricopeptide (TPR) repeat protein
MKKLLFAVLAVMVMATPMVNAQKINKESVKAKLEKADATLQDAKKNGKAATWMNHAKAYYEAATIATKDLYVGMTMDDVQMVLGEPTGSRMGVQLSGGLYNEFQFPWVTVYVAAANNLLTTWIATDFVVENKDLCAVALNSLNKAYELDAKQAKKISEELTKLENFYKQGGNVSLDLELYLDAAYFYTKAYEVQQSAAYAGTKSGDYPYFAGYLYTVDGQANSNSKSYEKGAAALNQALAEGFADQDGNIYFYLYVCYANQTDSPVRAANLERAKQVLMEGLAKFPENENIVEGLVHLYTSEDSLGNPADLVELVDNALERDPKNAGLWFGRGRIFFALENYDEAIVSFKKVVEITPEDSMTWFYIGYFYTLKGDAANEAFYEREYTSYEEQDKDMKAINGIYMEALPYLEKSYELNPENFSTIETLKALTFRLREEPGVMDKYNKYDEIYQQMSNK